MDNLNFKGTADFSQLFTEFDALEKRVAELARLPQIVVKPKLDLASQLLQLDAYEKRLKRLGGLPVGQGQTPTQRPVTTPAPAAAPVTIPQTTLTVAEALTKRLAQINNEAKILRSDFIAAGTAADVTDQEVAALQARVQTLRNELAQLRPIAVQTFGAASSQVRGLAQTTEQLQRTLAGATGQMSRLGIASQFKMAIDQSAIFNNPQGNINGIVQLVRGYEQARLSSNSFQKTLQRQNIEVDEAQQWVEKFATRFNVLPSTVEATSKVLLNHGYSIQQTRETMELYAASALVAAKDVGGAIDALAGDVQTQNTVLSNQYGIAANQATAYIQYAKSIGKVADALTAEEKAQGFLVALRREATNDLREADSILEGVGGTLGETTAEFRNAQRELGEVLLPTVNNGAKQLTAFLRAFNELPPAIKDSIANIVVWGTVLGAGRLVLGPLLSLLKGGVPLFKKLGELAGRGGAAGGLNAMAQAGQGAATGAAAAGRGLRDLSSVTPAQGFFAKFTSGLQKLVPGLQTGTNVAGQFIKSLAVNPATKGGLYGAVFALGYGVGTLINKIKTLNGLTVGQNVQNFSLKAFSGYSNEQVNQLRIDEARNAAFNKVMLEQADAVAKARDEKDKDLRSSKLRTLGLQRDLEVEQAALKQAQQLGDKGAVLTIQDRIKNLTTALGMERQNRAVIDANILAEQRRQELEEKRRPVLEALRKQQVELGSRSLEIRVGAKSDFERDMSDIAVEFRTARKKLEMQLASEKDIVIRAELQTTLGKLDRVNQQAVSARTAAEIKAGQAEIVDAQRTVEQARTGAIVDGVARRKAELDGELKSIEQDFAPKIMAALQKANTVTGPDRTTLQRQAGELQALQAEAERAARETAGRDLERLQDERVQSAREAEGRVVAARAAAAEGMTQILEGQRTREEALYGQTAQGKLRIEQRFESALVASRTEAARLRTEAEKNSLARAYAQQMTAAKDAGSQRGQLEEAARSEYLTKLDTLERASAEEIKGIQIDAQNDVATARLAVQKESLDRELKLIQTATGAELASLQLRLKARRAAAISSGDVRGAEQFATALRTVKDLNLDRVRDLKKLVAEAATGATDLRKRLKDALPQDPLERARAEAAAPISSVIKDAEARLSALRKAYQKVALPTGAQTADFRRQEGELTSIVTLATTQRTQAQAAAETKYYRERNDRAQESHLKLSKRELDLGKLTQEGYARQLVADRAYWQARRDNAAEGSEDREAADQKLRENDDELLRLATERRVLQKDSAAFSREELQRGVELATNERDRAQAIELLNASDRQRLSDLDAEIAKLVAQGGHERELLDLRRERAGLQGEINTRQREELEHARALTQSVLDRVDAENTLAEKLARTDAAAADARQAGIQNAYRRLGLVEGQVGEARSDEERNRLLADRLNLLGQIHDLELAAATAPLAVERERLDLQIAQRQLRTTLLGLSQDETAQAEEGLKQAQDTLRLAEERLAVMRREGNPSEQRAAETEEIRAQVAVLEARNRLIQAPITQERTRLQLLQSQGAASLALMGLGDDQVAQAQLKLEGAQRELVVANAALSVAVGRQQVEAALTGQANARVALVSAETAILQANASAQKEALGRLEALRSAQREYARAQIKAAQDLLAATQKQRDVEAIIGDLADDEVASAERALATSRERLDQTRELLQTSGVSPEDRAGLLTQEIELLGEVAEGERQVETAQRARRVVLEDLTAAQATLRLEAQGGSAASRALASAQNDLAGARLKVAQAERAYADAVARGRPAAVKTATDTLTSALNAQRTALQKVSDTYKGMLTQMTGVQNAGQQLNKTLGGDQPKIDTSLELDRFYAIQSRRQRAIQGLQDALRTGDMEAITTATRTLSEQEDRYRQQAELLRKNGQEVYLKDEPTVRVLAEQVDRLGIQYDREAGAIEDKADAAQQEADAATRFSDGVQVFAGSVDALLAGLQGSAEQGAGVLDGTSADLLKQLQSGTTRTRAMTAEERTRLEGELAQATAGLKGAVKQSLAEAGNQYSKAVREATGGNTPPRIAPRSEAQQQAVEAQLGERFGVDLAARLQDAITKAITPDTTARTPEATVTNTDNSRTITNNWTPTININQQPGEDVNALADRVVDTLQRRSDLIGTDC